MFRWLLKPKFYSKCISYVKFIKTRLETIEKRRRAVQKFTKSDIAELLRRGLHYEAYKRTEGLLFEQNMLSCYELIEKFIGCISDHVLDLTKQRDCPDECKEAVPSLMYAAARISDLPELRDLRTLFTEKFGNSLEPYTSKELVDKLRRDPPTREMKIRLLYDIAQEFSIEWDAKALKQKLYTHPSLYEERHKPDNTDNLVIGGENTDDGSDCNASKGKKGFNEDSYLKPQCSSTDDETSTDTSSNDGREAGSSSSGSVSEDEVEETKRPISYWFLPPPYLTQKTNKGTTTESILNKTTTDSSEALQKKESSKHHLHEKTTTPRSTRKRRLKSIGGSGQDSSVSDPKTLDYSGGMKPGNGKATTSHVRGKSLPTEPTTSAETSSTTPKEAHTRATSSDSQMWGAASWRVHPKLPDYDDLVARLAALRGR